MSHTNSTTNYELSQFLGSDKPAWLVDYNGDMLKIDTQMKTNAEAAAAVAEDVSELQSEIGSEGLTGRITQAENDIDSLETAVGSVALPTTAQTLTGAVAELKGVNDDQTTAIGNNATAIAQAAGNISGVSQLAYSIADVYDSTDTYAVGNYAINANTLYKCTTAIPVGEAFDSSKWTSVKVMNEMPSGAGTVDADDVSYDNTSSGLTATNVQDAIDELDSEIDNTLKFKAVTFTDTTAPYSNGTDYTVSVSYPSDTNTSLDPIVTLNSKNFTAFYNYSASQVVMRCINAQNANVSGTIYFPLQ